MPEIAKYVARANSNAEPGFGGGGNVELGRFRVKTVHPDGYYLICRSWNGTTEGSTDVLVALPVLLRDDKKPSDDHVIWPDFLVPIEEIFAAKPQGGTGVAGANEWLMLSDGRFWALDLEICGGKHAFFQCSALVDV